MNNKYYFLRHGKTIYQTKKKGIIYPAKDSPEVRLTKKAEKEIKKLAKRMKNFGIDLIYSSDLYRAKQTAEIVAKELGKKIIFDKKLRDINLGVWHGRKKVDFYLKFDNPKERFSKRLKGGESWSDVQKRILDFFKEIDKRYKNKKILIVSHGDPLWLLEGVLKKLSQKELLKEKLEKGYIQTGELRRL